jgi:hypothetical protein
MRYGSRPGDPAWSAAFPQLATFLLEYYGDAEPVQAYYDELRTYIMFLYGKVQSEGIGNLFSCILA